MGNANDDDKQAASDETSKFEKGGDNDCSNGPVEKRGCTDILCFLLYGAHFALFFSLFGVAMTQGDPRKLMAVRDYKGSYCGFDDAKQWNKVPKGFEATNLYDGQYSLGENWPEEADPAVYPTLGLPKDADADTITSESNLIKKYNYKNVEETMMTMDLDKVLGADTYKMYCATDVKTKLQAYDSGLTNDLWTAACGDGTTDTAGNSASAKVLLMTTSPNTAAASILADNSEALEEVAKYFTTTCVKAPNCLTLNKIDKSLDGTATGDNALTMRELRVLPHPDAKHYRLALLFWKYVDDAANSASLPGTPAYHTSLTVKALPKSVCPYTAKMCVPLPGMKYTPVGSTCQFALAAEAAAAVTKAAKEKLGALSNVSTGIDFGSTTGDVAKAWDTALIVAALSIVGGFLFMIFIRWFIGFIIWGSIFCVLALLCAVGGYAADLNRRCNDDSYTTECPPEETGGYFLTDEEQREQYGYIGAFFIITAAAYLILICCLKDAIGIGIAVNKVAARFIGHNKAIMFMPLLQLLLYLCYFAFWIVAFIYILSAAEASSDYADMNANYTFATAGDNENKIGVCNGNGEVTGSSWKDINSVSMFKCNAGAAACWRCSLPRVIATFQVGYAFFSMLWNTAFCVAVGQCTVAGAVAYWYFCPAAEKGLKPAIKPALYNCFRYHLGSLAFGSLILAVVQFIKWCLRYMQQQALQTKNDFMVKVYACLDYLIQCFERFIKFLNKNAYIQIAILGKNFCRSAWNAFMLIIRNAARIGMLAGIGFIVTLIGFVFMISFTAGLGYFILLAMHPTAGEAGDDGNEDAISNPWLNVFLYAVMGYIAAKLFMMVFGLAVDATLQCFIADEELAKNEGGAQHTPDELKPFLDNPGKKRRCCGKRAEDDKADAPKTSE